MSNEGSQERSSDEGPPGSGKGAARQHDENSLEMPAPTIWPLVLALGMTLTLAGIVTSFVFSAGGIVLAMVGLGGWIHQLLPGAGEQRIALLPPQDRAPTIQARPPLHTAYRALLPETVHPYSSGIAGGVAGGIAMAAVALVYGVASGHGIWYPINLLAGMLLPGSGDWSAAQLEQFHAGGLVLGILIHSAGSVGVGLLFSLLLPMLPGYPLIWGGVVGPLLWSGGIYASMGVLNPLLNRHVDWTWFVASQFAFGLVAGFVIGRTEKVVSGGPGLLTEGGEQSLP